MRTFKHPDAPQYIVVIAHLLLTYKKSLPKLISSQSRFVLKNNLKSFLTSKLGKKEEKMNKLSIIVLLTGIAVLLIGGNYSWAQKKPADVGIYKSWFNAIDTDGDGKISRNEHIKHAEKSAEKNFTGMDVNKDGFVSSEEFKKAMPKQRKKVKGKAK